MRRAAKIDANQPEIVGALEAVGCSVDVLPGGNGRPDLLVGVNGFNVLLEVKDGARAAADRKLNPLQKKWHAAWRGTAHLVLNVSQAIEVVGAYMKRK